MFVTTSPANNLLDPGFYLTKWKLPTVDDNHSVPRRPNSCLLFQLIRQLISRCCLWEPPCLRITNSTPSRAFTNGPFYTIHPSRYIPSYSIQYFHLQLSRLTIFLLPVLPFHCEDPSWSNLLLVKMIIFEMETVTKLISQGKQASRPCLGLGNGKIWAFIKKIIPKVNSTTQKKSNFAQFVLKFNL